MIQIQRKNSQILNHILFVNMSQYSFDACIVIQYF